MRIMGIDPGLRLTGYGCVEGNGLVARPRLVEAGVLRLRAGLPMADRLAELDADLAALLDRLAPDLVAVESLFAHYKHPATAIAMGHARGVILLAVKRAGLPLAEFRPTMVKKSLSGHGHASKEQVQRCIRDAFALRDLPRPPDVADALAIALCVGAHDTPPPAPIPRPGNATLARRRRSTMA